MTRLTDHAVSHLRDLVDHPDRHDRYVISECIGEGGMGAVYAAYDNELGREVALKVLRAPAPTEAEHARLMREAQILASLEHPGIVPVHDVGALGDGRLFYVMKRVRGERFDDFVRGQHTHAELLRAFLQVCDAVAFAHASGVIHRDLKPQNVMLGAFGEVLVLDWGVAQIRGASDQSGSASATAAGTPGYMAPEQAQGSADERADVFGLGGVLYFLITGEHPPAGSEASNQWSATDTPAALRAICQRARALEAPHRYQTVGALAADVANYLDARPVAAHAEGILERGRRVASRHRTAILLVLAYLVMRIAFLLFAGR